MAEKLKVRNIKTGKILEFTPEAWNNFQALTRDRALFEVVTAEKPKKAEAEESSEAEAEEKPKRTRRKKAE